MGAIVVVLGAASSVGSGHPTNFSRFGHLVDPHT
jgi:hypothetical protein